MCRKEAYQCLLKLVSSYILHNESQPSNMEDYQKYANLCSEFYFGWNDRVVVEHLKNPIHDENTRATEEKVLAGLKGQDSWVFLEFHNS